MNLDDAWIETFTGRKVWPLEPWRTDHEFYITDIAHALSQLCRYTGHCKRFFSVAQHSVNVALVVPKTFRLEALLHDASEAYLADVARPIKHGIAGYSNAENNLDKAIRRAYGLPSECSPEVKEADLRMLATEREQLFEHRHHWSSLDGVKSYDLLLATMTPEEAEWEFMAMFKRLYQESWRSGGGD